MKEGDGDQRPSSLEAMDKLAALHGFRKPRREEREEEDCGTRTGANIGEARS